MEYSFHYYDLVLLAIAASLGVGAAVGMMTPVAITTAAVAFGLLSIVIVGHALFVNGPIDEVADLADEIEPEEVPGGAVTAQILE